MRVSGYKRMGLRARPPRILTTAGGVRNSIELLQLLRMKTTAEEQHRGWLCVLSDFLFVV